MDCLHCEDQITELALGLLSAAAESEVRAHLATCPSCRAKASVLQEGAAFAGLFELAEPPERVRTSIVAIASAAAAERRNARPVAAVGPVQHPTLGARILDVVRRWATGPQGAMATITLLVVAIGLFYLPSHRPPMSAEGDTVLSPSSPEVVAAVPAATPPDVAAPAPAVLPTSLGASSGTSRTTTAAPEPAASERRAPEARIDDQASPVLDRLDEDRAGLVAESEPRRAEAFAEEAEAAAPPPAPAQPVAASRSRAMAPTAVATAPAVAQRAASADSVTPAAEAPAAAAPTDLLSMARAQRSASRCAAAAPLYEQWLAQNPGSGQRGPAIVELADCLRRTGRTEQARTWLERAAPTYALARRELERMAPATSAGSAAPAGAARTGAAAARPAESPAAGAATAVDSSY